MQIGIDALPKPPGNNALADTVHDAMRRALNGNSKINTDILSMEGMSGRKYRVFINNLIEMMDNPRYLEVGVWRGSTMCAATNGNRVRAVGIDNWSQFGGPRDDAMENIARYGSGVEILDEDYAKVDFASLGRFDVYFYDGPHTDIHQQNGIVLAQPALDDQFVLIVDDWNWSCVRRGTVAGLAASGLRLVYSIDIRTAPDDQPSDYGNPGDWHNGYFIAVCSKGMA